MRWSAADVRGTAASIRPWWALLTADLPAGAVARLRPAEIEPFLADTPPVADMDSVEAALRALSVAARRLAAGDFAVAPQTGTVAGIFRGDSGLPKQPAESAEVTVDGLIGDRQRTRKHHGRVWQALCLWSAEVVDTLRGEGHPVFAGACGENLLLSGIDWQVLRPGLRLRIGSAVAEVSLPTIPCKQIRPYFTAAAIRRIDHDRHPGSSRWYATVVQPGHVALGDPISLE